MMTALQRAIVLLLIGYLSSSTITKAEAEDIPVEYGADISFPMQHKDVSDNYPWLEHNVKKWTGNDIPPRYRDMPIQPLGNKKESYDEYVHGCVDHYNTKFPGKNKGQYCIESEVDRFAMSLRQPQSMVNYTKHGFQKIKCPEKVWTLLQDFYKKNKGKEKVEQWPTGNTYTNHWKAPTKMMSVEDGSLRSGGYKLKQALWDAAKETIQEWTGQELTQCSLYGIRIYQNGSMLAPHVDRLPLVSSAIINVAQDVNEPWPLEVIGHDGRAHNVTMEPGDMVLYESHSIIHGRPFPLNGNYYANTFIHFEPVGHTLKHHGGMIDDVNRNNNDVHAQYRKASEEGVGGHEQENHKGLPPYIIPGSPEVPNWKASHDVEDEDEEDDFGTGSTLAHEHAQSGNLNALKKELLNKDHVDIEDSNSWTPFHEAVRGGHLDIVKYLFDSGANINKRTSHGFGGSPLYYAKESLGSDHDVTKYLESLNAEYIEPEL